MPNPRRRRFSVQRDIAAHDLAKVQNGSSQECIEAVNAKGKTKVHATTSKIASQVLQIVTEEENSTTSTEPSVTSTVDKDVTATLSGIELYHNILNCPAQDTPEDRSNNTAVVDNGKGRKNARQMNRTIEHQKKIPHQHRVKVRSPKRRAGSAEDMNAANDAQRTVGTAAIDWEQELETFIEDVAVSTELDSVENNQRGSNYSIDDMCRICHGGESLLSELGQLISACSCRGTVGRVHVKCLEHWLTESGKSRCELCGTRYSTRRVHRYGVPRALLMWILSQNAKQLMVDSLGIMLMSPLAVLAAWLSGRTLAGLMTQDAHITPWPLASTFVLACMTLVCYYCWIVSAATRHALGWWIWYRSQYEVRLQLDQPEE